MAHGAAHVVPLHKPRLPRGPQGARPAEGPGRHRVSASRQRLPRAQAPGEAHGIRTYDTHRGVMRIETLIDAPYEFTVRRRCRRRRVASAAGSGAEPRLIDAGNRGDFRRSAPRMAPFASRSRASRFRIPAASIRRSGTQAGPASRRRSVICRAGRSWTLRSSPTAGSTGPSALPGSSRSISSTRSTESPTSRCCRTAVSWPRGRRAVVSGASSHPFGSCPGSTTAALGESAWPAPPWGTRRMQAPTPTSFAALVCAARASSRASARRDRTARSERGHRRWVGPRRAMTV